MKHIRSYIDAELTKAPQDAKDAAEVLGNLPVPACVAPNAAEALRSVFKNLFIEGYVCGTRKLAQVALKAHAKDLQDDMKDSDGWHALRLGFIVIAAAFFFGFMLRGCIPVPAKAW